MSNKIVFKCEIARDASCNQLENLRNFDGYTEREQILYDIIFFAEDWSKAEKKLFSPNAFANQIEKLCSSDTIVSARTIERRLKDIEAGCYLDRESIPINIVNNITQSGGKLSEIKALFLEEEWPEDLPEPPQKILLLSAITVAYCALKKLYFDPTLKPKEKPSDPEAKMTKKSRNPEALRAGDIKMPLDKLIKQQNTLREYPLKDDELIALTNALPSLLQSIFDNYVERIRAFHLLDRTRKENKLGDDPNIKSTIYRALEQMKDLIDRETRTLKDERINQLSQEMNWSSGIYK